MLTLTRAQSRELDRRAIEHYGIPGMVLMENAGRGCVDALERLGIHGNVVILCGKGNNAGDGFVIARHLEIRGHACRVLLLAPPAELRVDAAANFAILQKTAVPIVDLSQRAGLLGTRRGEASSPSSIGSIELRRKLNEHVQSADWLVDALLGTGAQGNPRPPFDTAIEVINSHQPPTRVLALDVPSGLDCDTGIPSDHSVRANHTCTFAALKTGYSKPTAQPYVGTIEVCDIGVPPRLLEEVAKG